MVGTLGSAGRWIVERGMYELQLKDGTLHRLHHVVTAGMRDQFLRALRQEAVNGNGAAFVVFDLCDLARTLAIEIPSYLARDIPGLVKYTLRALYPDAHAFRLAVFSFALAEGVPRSLE